MTAFAWYQSLPAFRAFALFASGAPFHRVPDGWTLIVTDIAGSTQAITEGRYKDVNTLGAASIVVARNAVARAEFPFSFGGDGAMMAVPDSVAPRVLAALEALAALAQRQFALGLRVGSFTVSDLARDGCDLEVAKFALAPPRTLAMFRGTAVARAETLLKASPPRDDWSTASAMATDLRAIEGLSCRWQPVPSLHGRMATLMVVAQGSPEESNRTYARVLASLEAIVGGDLASARPIHDENMSYRGLREMFRDEWRFAERRCTLPMIRRLAEILAAWLVFRVHIPPLVFSPARYAASMVAHSDFRKFDATLRLVLDLTSQQLSAVRLLLDALQNAGAIRYGLHESDTALMTCVVDSLGDGGHFHLVDGGDGGYALAARALKK